MKKQGIDVSYAQGSIDWKKVKQSGKVDFAFIRVGYLFNNGTVKIDDFFQSNIEGAIKNGIDVGVYVYSYASDPKAAKRGAKEVLALIKQYKVTYPIVFDIEDAMYTGTSKRQSNTDISKAFLLEIQESNYYGMLYAYKHFADNYLYMSQLRDFDFWLAQYANKPTYTDAYSIWQYTDKGIIAGVDRNTVDLNESYQDYATIISSAGLNNLKPTKPPVTEPPPSGGMVPESELLAEIEKHNLTKEKLVKSEQKIANAKKALE